jgi:hypothetical protein
MKLAFRRYRGLTAGLIVLAGLAVAMTSRAQPGPNIPTTSPLAVMPDPNSPSPTPPQPIAVQALDATRFVVVTREPRLMRRASGEGRLVNMVVPVVTHYTVQNGRLTPIEHVHVPEGWRPLGTAE